MDDGILKNPNWVRAIDLASLQREGTALFRHDGRQIALFATPDGIFACNNRCPHEGYPLREGTLSAGCVLTCNWHNWKFDLKSGANLDRGEGLRTYPVETREGAVWLDMTEQPVEQRRAAVMRSLKDAFEEEDYERLARDLARLAELGNPRDVVYAAIDWSWQRLEYGWTHAYAGMADWLALYDEHEGDREAQLICLLEILAHVAEDCLREEEHPFAEGKHLWNEQAFLAAVEAEDEDNAAAYLRGALSGGLHAADLELALTRAALAHYADFGHSLIYTAKAFELIGRLEPSVEAPLLLSLLRSLIAAQREDLIPEFRDYAPSLAAWGNVKTAPAMQDYAGLNARRALALTAERGGADPVALYRALLGANAQNLLTLDLRLQMRVDQPIADNASWLDVSHGITFANAVRRQCSKFPALWPQGLLQMACFAGRNSGFLDKSVTLDRWYISRPPVFFARAIDEMLDHGRDENIVAVHRLKTIMAARAESAAGPDDEAAQAMVAGMNRFLNSPLRRRHVRRTMRQAMQFVGLGE
ncbi:MAG TPA: Rieske (2Fe-2S) protein [Dongiaceae bacterium]|jgi:nitrite reductase/ring-hydroxylating ferredoxin subunit|nr:Rieske (2Fe-2S) protein [Dongiaceae bacterium]